MTHAKRRSQPAAGRQRKSPPSEVSRAAALDALVRLTHIIGAGRDMERVFDAVAEEIERVVPFDRCSFGYYDAAAHTLLVTHVRGRLPHYPDDGDMRPLAGTAAGVVAEQRRPLIHTVEPENRFSEDANRRAAGVIEAVLLPVVVDDAVVGVLALSSRQRGVYRSDDLWFLETIADHFGLAVAATNLRRDAERRAARAQFLVEVADLLGATTNPEAMLDQVLDAAATVLGDLNAVLLADRDSHELRLAAARTVAPDDLPLVHEILTRQEPPGTLAVIDPVADRGEVLIIRPQDESLPARFRQDAAHIGLQALLTVPMIEHGHVVGVYVSGRTAGAPPGANPLAADDLPLARELAARLASTLVSARLHAETRQALSESEALRRIGQELSSSVDVDQVFELVSSFARLLLTGDYAAVAAEHEDGALSWRAMVGNRADAHLREPFLPGYGAVSRAAAARRPVIIQDFPDNAEFPPDEFPVLEAEATRSALAVPLRAGEQIFGALVVGYRQPHDFPPGELHLAEALATQAAIALEHARLFAEAQRAIAHRDQFLSVAAHELRTPLTTLRGRVQLLRRRLGDSLTPSAAESLQIVLRQVDRLARMVNDLLDVSRVQSGRLPLVRERVDLVELTAHRVREAEHDEGPTVEFASDLDTLPAWVDPWRLEQVLANLLSNARRFSPAEGRVTVRLAREGDNARIEIEDEGIGIAPEHLERIFEPFFQVDPEPRMGVGLGLAICRQIVGDHGGRLWATSPGPGSTFVMTLPLSDE